MCNTNFRIVKIYMIKKQVCLISQSWNNVANMHELLTVLKLTSSENLNSTYHLPSCTHVCQIIVSIVHMLAAAAQNLTLLVFLRVRRSHPSIQQLLELATAMATFSLCQIYHQAMTKNRPCLSLCSRLGSLLSWPPFAPFIQERISMATLVCAYSTANLTNRGPSELVEECIFYSLQVRTWYSHVHFVVHACGYYSKTATTSFIDQLHAQLLFKGG